MSRDLVLGLDGGGSKTVVALANRDGAVTALHHGPGLDPFGNPQWRRDLAALVEAIGTGGGDLRRAVLGLSCHAEMKDVSDAQREAARRLFDVGVDVLNDVHVAFEGALAGRAGVLSLAGTGSMAWAGDGRGLHRRTGGWGDLIGDEGSGYWIGREALSDITRTIDGRSDHAAFARSLLEKIEVDQHGLLAWVYGLPHRRSGIAALAVMVDGLADAGDPTAARLMARAADELSRQVRAAWRLIGAPEPLIWSYAGSVFTSASIMRGMVDRLGPPTPPQLPPVGGAILEAARRSGWATDTAWRSRLAATLAAAIRPGGVPEQPEQGCTA